MKKEINQFKHKSSIPKMQWVVNKRRKDKRTGVISPVKPSKYYKYLCQEVVSNEKEN